MYNNVEELTNLLNGGYKIIFMLAVGTEYIEYILQK